MNLSSNDLKMAITAFKEKEYTIKDYLNALEETGIKKGDTICVHSQIFSFGSPLCEKKLLLEYFYRILREIIGKEGTLLMPTFSYSFCNGVDYDIQNTLSTVGILTEYFRQLPDVKRTGHPIFSFSVLGKREQELLNTGYDAFDDKTSVYGKLLQSNDSIILFGAPKGYTFYYLAEQFVGVSHRYIKNFQGNIIDNGKRQEVVVPYYVRRLDMRSAEDEQKVDSYLLESNVLNIAEISGGSIRKVTCKDIFKKCVEKLRSDEKYFLKDN